ncbi:MAG: histidine phosphatase family protein [Pirellulales bacterium]
MAHDWPEVYLARHGETAWAMSGKYTGLSDIPLTPRGERNATALGQRLDIHKFSRVFSSHLQRQRRTCELAGFGDRVEIDPRLVEWNYGEYDGLTRTEIYERNPDWDLFIDGCPGGESPADVIARADSVIADWRKIEEKILAFSSGHFSRVLAARWCGFDVAFGKHLYLATAALNVLGYNRDLSEPAVRLWNDCRHVRYDS